MFKRFIQRLAGSPPPPEESYSHPDAAIEPTTPTYPPTFVEGTRVVSMGELASRRRDLWVAIEGNVYDLGQYAEAHPGGDDILRDVAGRNATQEWRSVRHSAVAKEVMRDMLIGTLIP